MNVRKKKNSELHIPFSDRLHMEDTELQTYGCRHSNPDICSSASIPEICAFTSPDGICKKPSKAWKKQYAKLQKNNVAAHIPWPQVDQIR